MCRQSSTVQYSKDQWFIPSAFHADSAISLFYFFRGVLNALSLLSGCSLEES